MKKILIFAFIFIISENVTPQTKWEKIDYEMKTGNIRNRESHQTFRMKVYRGWIVKNWTYYYNKTSESSVFVPDVSHKWHFGKKGYVNDN